MRASLVERAERWRWGSLWRWLQPSEPEPHLLSPWPIPRSPRWVERVNEPLSEQELKSIRRSVQRGRPFGTDAWLDACAKRLQLESTLRPRGRPQVRPLSPNRIKES